MEITLGPFLMCFLVTLFLAGYLYIIMHHSSIFREQTIKYSMIGILLILIRMTIPINFPFTYTIYSYKFLPKLVDFTTRYVADSNLQIVDLMYIVWFVIAIILLIQLVIQYIRLRHYLLQFCVENDDKYRYLFNLLHKYCERRIRIAIIPEPISPAITGFLKPTLILPNIDNFSHRELEYILMHEVAHYQKRHLWFGLMMEVFCRIHWWNPFVQYVKKEFSLFLELSNDFLLIQSTPTFDVVDYADLIVKTAKKIHYSKSIMPTPMMNFVIDNKTILATRIHFILDNRSSGYLKNPHSILCLGIICISVLLSVFVVPEARFPNNPEETNGAIEITKENAYILETEEGYALYVEDNYFGNINHIPKDLENIPIYKKGDSMHEK